MTKLFAIATGCLAMSIAVPERPAKFSYVDLQAKANQKLTDNFGSGREGNNLGSFPKGEQTFDNVKFKVDEGMIQLGSMLLKVPKPNQVEGIKVGRKFAKFHVLHATGYGNGSRIGQEGKDGDPLFVPDGTTIAEFRLRYEDGTTEVFPVVYGQDVRDWHFTEGMKGVTRGKIVWIGTNELVKNSAVGVRLYMNTWDNPRPQKHIVAIDYVKVNATPAAPFCVAITLEDDRGR